MRSPSVGQRFLSTLPGSDRFGDGQPPSGSAIAAGPASLFRFYTMAGCLLISPARLHGFSLTWISNLDTFFDTSIFRDTDTLISSRSRSRYTSLQFAVPTARDLLHGLAAIPPIHSSSTSLAHFEKAKPHRLFGSLQRRGKKPKEKENCVGDRLISETHLRAESRGQSSTKKVWPSLDSRHSGRCKPPGLVVTERKLGCRSRGIENLIFFHQGGGPGALLILPL